MNEENESICSIAKNFDLKQSFSQLPNISPRFRGILKDIAVFTRTQSFTVAFSEYTAFLKIYI